MNHTQIRRTAPARRRSHPAQPLAPARPAAQPAAPAATASARRGAESQDAALYQCHCGCDFRAAVITTVTCPSCGDGQDW